LSSYLDMVKEFHQAGRILDSDAPTVREQGIRALRFNLMAEELSEYRQAARNRDMLGILDALCDMQYVLSGTILAHGLGGVFEEAFAEVHRSNMSKFAGGEVRKRCDGKVLKPDTWTPPDLQPILDRAAGR